MHKFDFNWTLKDAQFTKKRSLLYFIIPARLQLCRTITALCVWNVRATRNDGANRKPNLGILAIKDLEIYVLL